MKHPNLENISVFVIESSTTIPKPSVNKVSRLESQLRNQKNSRIRACLGLKPGLYVLGRNLFTVRKIHVGIYLALRRSTVSVTLLGGKTTIGV